MPRPFPLPWGAPKRLAPQSRRQRSSSFPRPTRSHAHRCSRLTRHHGGEQSGLILTFAASSLLYCFRFPTLKAVSESRVTWATSVPISVFLGLSVLDLGPMYATDRQTDRRQTAALFNAPANKNNDSQWSAIWRPLFPVCGGAAVDQTSSDFDSRTRRIQTVHRTAEVALGPL